MFRVVSLAVLLALCAIMCAPPATADQSWGTRSGFSLNNNPAGHWSLGYIDDSAGFTLYNTRFEPGGGIVGWCEDHDPDKCGNVTINPTTQPIDAFSMRWEPGQVIIHPGLNGCKAAVRWTSPISASIRLNIAFTGQGNGGCPARVSIVVNGTGRFTSRTSGFVGKGAGRAGRLGEYPEEYYAGTLTVSRGDKVDFVVSPDAGNVGGAVGVDIVASSAQVGSGDMKDSNVFAAYGFLPLTKTGQAGWLSRLLMLAEMPADPGSAGIATNPAVGKG